MGELAALTQRARGLAFRTSVRAMLSCLVVALLGVAPYAALGEPARPPAAGPKKKPHHNEPHKTVPPKASTVRPLRPASPPDDGSSPLPSAPAVERPARTSLPNGLRVVIAADSSDTAITVALRFDEGGRADPKDRSGVASLSAEVLRFEGSEASSALLRRGGAETVRRERDNTTFVIRLPSSDLDLALYAEAERLRPKKTEASDLARARETLGLSSPAVALDERLEGLVFQGSPAYAHPLIGTAADREKASTSDIDDMARTHFGTSNAVLIVAGNIDSKEALARVEQRFSGIPRTDVQPSAKVDLEEQTNQRTVEIVDSDANPTLLYGWALPEGKASSAELQMAAALLTSDGAGRLKRALADVGGSAAARIDRRHGPGLFTLRVEVPKGADLMTARKTVEASLTALGKDLATPAELSLGRREAWMTALEATRDPEERALALADENADLEAMRSALESVDGPKLRDAAAKLLGPLRRTVVVARSPDSAVARPASHRSDPAVTAPGPKPAPHEPGKPPKHDDPRAAPRHPAKRKGAP